MMDKKKIYWNGSVISIGLTALLFWVKTIALLNAKPNTPAIQIKPQVCISHDTIKLSTDTIQKISWLKSARIETGQKICQASEKASHVVALGLKKLGRPYVFGGMSDRGFDCSGFVHFVFSKTGITVPRSSELLARAGKLISRQQARTGDIIIFTGTNSRLRRPGHVGIVIEHTEKLTFVHASSDGGVKVSQVEDSNYERRFLEIRRVL